MSKLNNPRSYDFGHGDDFDFGSGDDDGDGDGSGDGDAGEALAQTAKKPQQSYPIAPKMPVNAKIHQANLIAALRSQQLIAPPALASDLLGYSDGLSIIRLQHGEWLEAVLTNHLHEHTTIHWHGIRLPIAMDGVPYLTQAPVMPGEEFVYRFQPPDTGTFIFHPHCNTVEQLGRGLAGVLIVEGDEIQPHDHEVVCVYRDWRIDRAGKFQPMMTHERLGQATPEQLETWGLDLLDATALVDVFKA